MPRKSLQSSLCLRSSALVLHLVSEKPRDTRPCLEMNTYTIKKNFGVCFCPKRASRRQLSNTVPQAGESFRLDRLWDAEAGETAQGGIVWLGRAV